MDHQARPCLTSLHIGNAHFYLTKEMNFCSEHRMGSSFQLSFSCYQEVLFTSYCQIPAIILNGAPVELNQGAELCFLTFLKFLKDKQVLSDRQFALGLSSPVESSFSSIPQGHQGRGPGYSLWCCLCSDLQPLVGWKGHPFSAPISWAP